MELAEELWKCSQVLYLPPFWLHRTESVNESVSVSSWFDDPLTQRLLGRSAALPLLPMLPSSAGGERPGAGEVGVREKAVAVLWAYLSGLGSVGARATAVGAGGLGHGLGLELWEQRYRPLLGSLPPPVLREWRALCAPAARAAAMERLPAAEHTELERLIGAKRQTFAALRDSVLGEEHADGVARLLVLDEAELTLAVLLGDASVFPFLGGCFSTETETEKETEERGEG
jgi:hypothetical protein